MTAFRAHLARAKMGTQVHLAGSEAFLDEASAVAVACGIVGDGLTTELSGPATRRVQCVHCKGMMDEVAVTPFACSHCGINLTVRDHYSRRLGAFMGVCADAEAPGVLPAASRF
nr:dimethylamine monooxygenase subunit DmmA family protein [Jiella avicenniae]